MKNTLKELLEKCKELWSFIKQNRKIKYGIIAGLVGVIVVTLGVFTALGLKEATELPTNDMSCPAISEYDNVTVIEIGDDSDTDDVTGDDTEGTVSGSESAESDTADSEETSDDEPEEGSEDTSEVPSDNEETAGNDDPAPAEPSNGNSGVTNDQGKTPSKNTQGTTNNPANTQSTTKPPVTTQATTKPPVNTTQNTTKPAETTKPVETPTGFVVKEKKYDYKDGNVMILDVTNNTSKNYTITIKGTYKDANGNVLKTESKTLEGYPAGYQNYFVFNPGIKFDSFSYELTGKNYTRETLAQNFSVGNEAFINIAFGHVDGNGNYVIPTSPEEIASYPQHVCLGYRIGPVKISYNAPVNYSVDIVFFDSDGNICAIGSDGSGMATESGSGYLDVTLPTKELWENKDKYQLPDNLKNVTAIVGLKYITES